VRVFDVRLRYALGATAALIVIDVGGARLLDASNALVAILTAGPTVVAGLIALAIVSFTARLLLLFVAPGWLLVCVLLRITDRSKKAPPRPVGPGATPTTSRE
jgi:hypothetical protein